MFYTNDHLSCSASFDAQYPLSNISTIQQGGAHSGNSTSIAIYQNETIRLPRGDSSNTRIGVKITTKQSDDGYYDLIIIAFGSLDGGRFARGLLCLLEIASAHTVGARHSTRCFNEN